MRINIDIDPTIPDDTRRARQLLDLIVQSHAPTTIEPPAPAITPPPPPAPAAPGPAAVPPPPPPPAPPSDGTATAAEVAADVRSVAAGVELDSAGFPWDATLHAASRKKIADGTWRRKRGVKPEDVAAHFASRGVAPPPPADVPPPPPPPAAEAGAPTWDDVMAALQRANQSATPDQVKAALAVAGIDSVKLVSSPDQYAAAIEALGALC